MDKELAYVRSLIEKARQTSERRLPSIRQMHEQSGLSRHRLHRAVAALSMQRAIVVKKGDGIYLPAPPARRSVRQPGRRSRRDHLYTTIVREIRRGRYRAGSCMPLVKELAERYGTDRATMRRALDSLTADGWLRHERRHWHVRNIEPAGRVLNEIVLLGVGLDEGLHHNMPWRSRELIRLIDLECNARGIRLRLCGLQPLLQLTDSGAHTMLRNSLGVIVWLFGDLGGLEWHELIRRASRYQKRVTVWDDRQILPHPGQAVPRFPTTVFYSIGDSEDDGRDVAMHVLQRGHRRAVYITHEPDLPWSRIRYEGIRRAFERCGHGGGCGVVSCGGALLRAASPESQSVRERVLSFLETFWPMAQDGTLEPPTVSRLNALTHIRDYIKAFIRLRALEPVFDELLRTSDTTVWICANDEVAFLAKEHLDVKGTGGAPRPSMIGFDDSATALHAQISSYNFDLPGVAAEMVDGIVNSRPRDEHGVVLRVPGFVNDRGSVFSATS